MPAPPRQDLVAAELVAVITAVHGGVPLVLTTADGRQLPAGPLQAEHRSLQTGMRSWVARQTGYELGYIEQLYTFAGWDRGPVPLLEVSYLGLTAHPIATDGWRSWTEYFPWEDGREGGTIVDDVIAPALEQWAAADGVAQAERRRQRCAVTFGLDGNPWLPGMTLQRYELLYEAGLVPEARDGEPGPVPGAAMAHDHRRILATGIGRLRAKIQYRPLAFELLPAEFTLGRLQGTVEAVAGQLVHKQNFRRLIEQQDLVEETGELDATTGGRPAKLFRFRREVIDERDAAGTKLPIARSR
ncbi:NUDIX hydrolase [Georgenia sunbinii]|uniref:NUDIX hydrolase n=1 Tax=Georgenia sunbinii TaxID=3117728 RepID=UPI002F2605D9